MAPDTSSGTHRSRAGQPAEPRDLVDVAELVTAYYIRVPDPSVAAQRVAFGTSGHRGSALSTSFNEAHILATTQAICEYRTEQGIDGPLFLGADSHALSAPATASALEVLAANGVRVLIDSGDRFVPTPSLSRAIIAWNTEGIAAEQGGSGTADGIVVTPSHNPPPDGGFKYNPPDGGPAGTEITGRVQDRANELLAAGLDGVKRVPYERALRADTTGRFDFLDNYVGALPRVVDLAAIAASGLRIGADPLGGASVDYWGAIGERYGLALTVVNPLVDRTFGFMTLDWDGKIRMDCSSPSAMAGLVRKLTGADGDYDIATGNDTDADRHGIVTPDAGLMNPNHYLAVAIDHLYRAREGWPASAAVGKTMVSSSMIDRVVADLGRELYEVPVGFKWFVPGLREGTIAFGGEESAGASFLTMDGAVWTTDKDGIILDLLASEIAATGGKSPSQRYGELTERFGAPVYARVDAPATPEQKKALGRLSAEQVTASDLAGDPIEAKLTAAPGNGAALGGLKVTTANGWFAARPSGTEDVYKLYAESFVDEDHLHRIQDEARELVTSVLDG